MDVWKKIMGIGMMASGAVAGALGGWDEVLKVLLVMMGLDYLTGLWVAILGKSGKSEHGGLSSKAGFTGLLRKGLMLLLVLAAARLDSAMGTKALCRDAVCWFYVANEGLSLLENLSLAGVPFPQKLKELLGQKKAAADAFCTETAGTSGGASAASGKEGDA